MRIGDAPFTESGDDQEVNANKGRRVQIVRDFIGFDPALVKSLDIGGSNAFGRILGIRDNTEGDLNHGVQAPCRGYDFILCSEIFEHLMNPLQVMLDIKALLKPDGVCVLSTPVRYPIGWFQSPHHFTEYDPKRLRKLFEYAGFKIVDFKIYSIWDWWPFMFTGVRPFLRVLMHRSQLWKLRK